jgi:hypothetical protein
MKTFLLQRLWLIGWLGTFLVGCDGHDPAAGAVQGYLKALVAKDAVKLSNYSCADWEADAQIDLDAFTSVGTSLKDLQCKADSTEGNLTVVACTGKIVADYDGDLQEIDLSARKYLAVQEGGEWRMCGYR